MMLLWIKAHFHTLFDYACGYVVGYDHHSGVCPGAISRHAVSGGPGDCRPLCPQVLAAPWPGKLSDHFGRRPILLISQAGTIVSYLLLIFAVPLGALLDHTGLRGGSFRIGKRP